MEIFLHIRPKTATDEPASLQTLSILFGPRDSRVLPTCFAAALETAVLPRGGPVPRHFSCNLPQYLSVTEAANPARINLPTAFRLRERDAGRAFHFAREEVVELGRRRLLDEFVSRVAQEVDGRMATVNFVNFAAPALSSAGELDAPMATVNFVKFIRSRRRRGSVFYRRTRISSSGANSTSSRLSPGPARSTTRKSLSSRTSRKWCQTPFR